MDMGSAAATTTQFKLDLAYTPIFLQKTRQPRNRPPR